MRALLLASIVLVSAQAAAECSPFDKDPANASVVAGRLPDGGQAPDQNACCDGTTSDDGCGPSCQPNGSVGAPVDTLSGFMWLDRTDLSVPQPWGPPVAFHRHYSTSWAQGAGGSSDIGALGPGWSYSYSAHLQLTGTAPSALVVLRTDETKSEEFWLSQGTYASRHSASAFSWDATTRLYTAERPNGSALVFDENGRLRLVRASDGGEAQVRHAGDDAACAVSASLPAGALCRVDFLFGRQLWFSYDGTGHLARVSLDAATGPLVVNLTSTSGLLTGAEAADGHAETYTYGFTHKHLTAHVPVKLLTVATDADGTVVESFTYLQPALSPSRVSTHATPTANYNFEWAYRDTASPTPRIVRETTVRSSRENLKLTWADGALTSACMLDAAGNCDVTRLQEYVRAPGRFDLQCIRDAAGHFTRSERDDLGRVVAQYSGLSACDEATDDARKHATQQGYRGMTSSSAWESSTSVDATAPAAFRPFTAWDNSPAATAVDPFCGTDACQRPEAYSTGAPTDRVRRVVRMGRTLLDVEGHWGTQVQVTTFDYDGQGRLISEDGPRRDVQDVTQYEWSASVGPWARSKVTQAGRVVQQLQDFDVRGHAHTVIDENGNSTSHGFDVVGRPTTLQQPGESGPHTWSYLPSGRLASASRPDGFTTSYEYDSDGQVSSVKGHFMATGAPDVRWDYTRDGKRLSELTFRDFYSQGHPTKFEYDSQGRQQLTVLRRDATDINRLEHRDEDGRIDWMADEGHLTVEALAKPEAAKSHRFTYDAWGELAEVQQLLGGQWVRTATFTYDLGQRLSSFTDAKGVRVRYQYDDFGRLVEVESPDFGLYRHVYDEAGNVVADRQPNGRVLVSSWDASNRLLSVKEANQTLEQRTWGGGAPAVPDCAGATWPAANSAGHVSQVSDTVGDWYFGYWPTGQLRYEALARTGASCAKTFFYEFDATGLQTAVRYPSGLRVEYGYPAAGNPLHDRPQTVTVVLGTTRQVVLKDLAWESGEVNGLTAGSGAKWSLARWLDGAPVEGGAEGARPRHAHRAEAGLRRDGRRTVRLALRRLGQPAGHRGSQRGVEPAVCDE